MDLGQRVGRLEADQARLLAALEQVTTAHLALLDLVGDLVDPAPARPQLRLIVTDKPARATATP
jgi:hypothetical protein